jgi:hypothetical protein
MPKLEMSEIQRTTTKQLTKQAFAESVFLAGNGTDLQPLLRLNHLLTPMPVPGKENMAAVTFVSATAGTPFNLDELKTAIQSKLKKLADLEHDCLVIAEEPRLLTREDLDAGPINLEVELLNRIEREKYTEQLAIPYAKHSWAAEIIFERGVGTGRFIRFIHIGGEALATLSALSHGGEFTPKIIVTVQTGPLEEPSGPLARMLTQFKRQPELWVRGRWAHRDFATHRYEYQRLGRGTYNKLMQTYPFWNGCLNHADDMPAGLERHQTRSIVRAFRKEHTTGLRDIVELKNGPCTIRLIKQKLLPNLANGATLVVSKHVKNKWALQGHDVSSVQVWEDFDGALKDSSLQPFTLKKALNSLSVNNLEKHRYSVLPVGFEDEGFRLLEFLSLEKNIEINIYFEGELDFADLRGGK